MALDELVDRVLDWLDADANDLAAAFYLGVSAVLSGEQMGLSPRTAFQVACQHLDLSALSDDSEWRVVGFVHSLWPDNG